MDRTASEEPASSASDAAGIHLAVLDVYPPPLRNVIREKVPPGWHCKFAEGYDAESQHAALEFADVAFANWFGVNAAALTGASRLRLIHKLGAGVDKIDDEACRMHGVRLARIAGGNAASVAEHTIMLILAALRRLPEIDERTRRGEWFKEEARVVQRQLAGRRVGLIGLGAIGQAVARRLAGFEVDLVYYDTVRLPPGQEKALHADFMDLEALVSTADIVSLHLPLIPSTESVLNADRIRALKPDAVVVNCARGGLLDEEALIEALGSGRILAAGLDTFRAEPPVGSPLLSLPNTVVTGHVAGATFDNFGHMVDHAVANTTAFLRGDPIPDADIVV